MSASVAAAPQLRASDAERERAASALRDHAAVGRLDFDELAQRLDAAYVARTRAELNALLADLPRSTPAGKQLGFRIHRNVYVLIGAMMLAIWALTGAGYFWPVWPLAGWGIGMLSHAFACHDSSRAAGGD
jgi:hypothetical protein